MTDVLAAIIVITTLWNMIISPCRLCSNYWIGDDGREGLRGSLCLFLDLTTAISSSYIKCTQDIYWNNSLRWEVNVKDWKSCKQTAERLTFFRSPKAVPSSAVFFKRGDNWLPPTSITNKQQCELASKQLSNSWLLLLPNEERPCSNRHCMTANSCSNVLLCASIQSFATIPYEFLCNS